MLNTKFAISLVAASGCAVFAQPRSPVRHTVPPGQATAIPVRTLANATCVLQKPGSTDPGETLTLYADQDGMIRFHARPSAESENNVQLELSCRAGNDSERVPRELQANAEPSAAKPAPVDLDPR